MQVSVESAEGLERRLKVVIPEDRVSGEVDKRLKDLAGSVRIPGFRPGKVPRRVLVQRYGKQVRGEVIGEIVQNSFVDAVRQENLQPAGTPRIDPLEADPGSGLSYTATFDVYPTIELQPIDALTVTRPVAEVVDADVVQMLETLRRQRRTWVEVDREATSTDRVTIDFVGTMDGERFDGGAAEGFELELDGARMVPGFEAGLVGVKGGETRTLDLTFPEVYHNADLAGKPVRFEVTTAKVEESVLPELDEDFAQSYGVSEGGMEGFRVEVRANMQRELVDALRAQTKQRVMDALLERESIEIPASLVEQEQAQLHEARRQEIARMGIDPDQVPADDGRITAEARRRVSLGLILAEVIKSNDIRVDPERVRSRVETVASTYQDPEEVVRWYYSDPSRLSEVESGVLEDQVVDWLLERARVTEETSSFDAILNAGQTSSAASA